jgi:hypothetical protein
LRAKLQESINVADLLAGRWVFRACRFFAHLIC